MSPETLQVLQSGGAAIAVVLLPAFAILWARMNKLTDERIANAEKAAASLAASTEALRANTVALDQCADALDRAQPERAERPRASYPGSYPRAPIPRQP